MARRSTSGHSTSAVTSSSSASCIDRPRAAARPRAASWRTISARRSAKLGDHLAFVAQRARRSCRRRDRRSSAARLEAMAVRRAAGREAERAAPARRRRRAARPGRAPGARTARRSSRRRAGSSSPWGSAAWRAPRRAPPAGLRRACAAATAVENSASALPSAMSASALPSAREPRPASRRPSACELLQQRRRRLAVARRGRRYRHQLLRHRACPARLRAHARDRHGEAARRGERRGDADRRRAGRAPCRPSTMPSANASPSFFSAFGGSSSANSSTSERRGASRRQAAFFCIGGDSRPGAGAIGKPSALARFVVALRDAARQVADAADVGGALGDGDRAARVEQVERVRGLQHLLVGGQRELLRPSGAWPRSRSASNGVNRNSTSLCSKL